MSIRKPILICVLSVLMVMVAPSSSKPLGAWDQVDLNDPMLAKVLVFAMQNLTADGSTYVNPHVTQAQSQVVAGLKYRITVQAARANNPSNHETHQFIVWYRPGGAMQVLQHQLMSAPAFVAAPSIEASSEKQKSPLSGHRHRMGGYSPVDVNDAQVQKLAAFGLQEINSRSNSAVKFTLTRVVRAARQVVAGLQYRIVLELSMPDHHSEFHFVTVWDHFGTLKFVNHHVCESESACTLQRPHHK